MAQEKKDKAEKASKSEAKHEEEHVSAKESHSDDGHDDKAHSKEHGEAHGDHEHKPNYREYWIIFGALLLLTVLEVGVAQVPGISKTLMRSSLVLMALAKAALVALFYMHLKHETKVLRLTVAIPLATPMLYAVILISEAAWRLIR